MTATAPATRPKYDPLITHAAKRGRVGLFDGRTVTLIAVHTRITRDGHKARTGSIRVEFDNGQRRTYRRADIAHIYPLGATL